MDDMPQQPEDWAVDEIIKLLLGMDGMEAVRAFGILETVKLRIWTTAVDKFDRENKK